MAGDIVEIRFPLGGLNRAHAFQHVEPYTTVDCLNVRSKDVFLERLRGGSRPGLVQVLPAKTTAIDETPTPPVSYSPDYNPTYDTYLDASLPTSPQGTSASMRLGAYGASNRYRPVMYFDLSDIPITATVTAATLALRLGATNTAGALNVEFHRLTVTNWVEAECTWERASTATDWTDGGDYSTPTVTAVWPSTTSTVETFTITSLVADAIANRAGALHILMKIENDTVPAADDQASFGSRTASNSAHWPTLTVEYTT